MGECGREGPGQEHHRQGGQVCMLEGQVRTHEAQVRPELQARQTGGLAVEGWAQECFLLAMDIDWGTLTEEN